MGRGRSIRRFHVVESDAVTPPVMRVPTELLDEIFRLLHRRDLCALCLTHSSLLPVAQRLLFGEIGVADVERAAAVPVNQVLSTKPHVASYVRSFDITLHFTEELDRPSKQCGPVYNHIGNWTAARCNRLSLRAIESMSQLKHLGITNFAEDTCVLLRLASCSFHLSSFEFANHTYTSVDIATFLQSQPGLVELRLIATGDGLDQMPETVMPRLRRLTTSFEIATLLVPHRPIKTLSIQSMSRGPDVLKRGLPSLSLSTGPIQVFRLELNQTGDRWPAPGEMMYHMSAATNANWRDVELDYENFRQIALHLPHLVELTMHLKAGSWIGLLCSPIALAAFRALAHLETFKFHCESWSETPSQQVINDLVQRFMYSCFTLRNVEVRNRHWLLRGTTRRGLEDGSGDVNIELCDDYGIREEMDWDDMDDWSDYWIARHEMDRQMELNYEGDLLWQDEGDTRATVKRVHQQAARVQKRMGRPSQPVPPSIMPLQQRSRRGGKSTRRDHVFPRDE